MPSNRSKRCQWRTPISCLAGELDLEARLDAPVLEQVRPVPDGADFDVRRRSGARGGPSGTSRSPTSCSVSLHVDTLDEPQLRLEVRAALQVARLDSRNCGPRANTSAVSALPVGRHALGVDRAAADPLACVRPVVVDPPAAVDAEHAVGGGSPFAVGEDAARRTTGRANSRCTRTTPMVAIFPDRGSRAVDGSPGRLVVDEQAAERPPARPCRSRGRRTSGRRCAANGTGSPASRSSSRSR